MNRKELEVRLIDLSVEKEMINSCRLKVNNSVEKSKIVNR